jgi:hypothetical protein
MSVTRRLKVKLTRTSTNCLREVEVCVAIAVGTLYTAPPGQLFFKPSFNPKVLVVVTKQSIVEPILDTLTVINTAHQSHTDPART